MEEEQKQQTKKYGPYPYQRPRRVTKANQEIQRYNYHLAKHKGTELANFRIRRPRPAKLLDDPRFDLYIVDLRTGETVPPDSELASQIWDAAMRDVLVRKNKPDAALGPRAERRRNAEFRDRHIAQHGEVRVIYSKDAASTEQEVKANNAWLESVRAQVEGRSDAPFVTRRARLQSFVGKRWSR